MVDRGGIVLANFLFPLPVLHLLSLSPPTILLVGILFTLFPRFYTLSARIYTHAYARLSHTRLMLMHAHIHVSLA